jgi:nucleotidyltransferase/DNA polymerase involved in DNA repair
VGEKTAAVLQRAGIHTVRDIYNNQQMVIALLGNHGREILSLADGIDERQVIPYAAPKSIGKEHTFQQDITDFNYLKDCLRLIAKDLSFDVRRKGLYAQTVTLKVKYANMQSITRSQSGDPVNAADNIYKTAASNLDRIDKRPIRLIGISLSNFTESNFKQLSFESNAEDQNKEKLDDALFALKQLYGPDIIKTASELSAQKRFEAEK